MSTTAIASVMTDVTTVVITETTTGFGKYHFLYSLSCIN